MQKRKLKVVLDPAHGNDVVGKCSPDKSHYEWMWSRERCKNIKVLLEEQGFEVYYSNDTDKEIGLSKRVSITNALCKGKENEFILISLHNNAAGMGDQWMTATGFENYITDRNNKSKDIANTMLSELVKDFPTIKNRGLKTANFTVITVNCYSFLLEFLFQDNKNDVELLKDPKINKIFEECIRDTFIKIDEQLFGTYLEIKEEPSVEIPDNSSSNEINNINDETVVKPLTPPSLPDNTINTNSPQSNNIITIILNFLSKLLKGILGK